MRWLCAFSLLVLIALSLIQSVKGADAQLPNPNPSTGETGNSEQQHRSAVATNTSNEKAPTRSAISAVNQIPSVLAAPPSNGDGNQGSQESPSNRWLIFFTGALVVVGVLQFCAMTKQARYMRCANGFTRGNLRAAIRNAKAAIENAEAAKRQSITLEQTLSATEKAAQAAVNSAELANRALNANRPYLLIVNEMLYHLYAAPPKDEGIFIQFSFKNCGNSPAVISTIYARLVVTKTVRPAVYDSQLNAEAFPTMGGDDMYCAIGWIDKCENILAAGETSSPYTVNLDTTMYPDVAPGTLRPETRAGIMNHDLLVMLHGSITYTDVLQQKYPTEFMGYFKVQSTNREERFDFEFKDREPRKED